VNQGTRPIAVVLPVYRHSALVFEAVASLVDQPEFAQCNLVIVDDGCPSIQTPFDLSSLGASFPNIHFVRHANAGLSGARNRGIEFVLSQFADAQAIFFLDADNRLRPHALKRFLTVLQQSKADWFYPDIDMFGIAWNGDYSGPFSRLGEIFYNMCEAGSLVRRHVFEAGLRFDENMKAGFEDWEFWQAAIELGFTGEHVRNLGLMYRQRAESMLAESNRMRPQIVQYIETKHRWTANLDALLLLEHKEVPRYAIYLHDVERVHLTSDPARRGRVVTLEQYRRELRASFGRPQGWPVGVFFVTMSAASLADLLESRMAHAAFWNLEQDLLWSNAFSLFSVRSTGSRRLQVTSVPFEADADAVCVRMDVLRNVIRDTPAWIRGLTAGEHAQNSKTRLYTVPGEAAPTRPSGDACEHLLRFCIGEQDSGYPDLWTGNQGRSKGTRDAADLSTIVRSRYSDRPVPNWFGIAQSRIAIVLPILEFGGVEKVALALATELRRVGYQLDLYVLGRSGAALSRHESQSFDRIFLLNESGFNDFSGPDFQGTALPRQGYPTGNADLANLLSGYQAVIGSHAADLLGCFAQLRRRGVVTVNHLHLLERTESDRFVGHVVLGLAYEHATDLFLTCSERLATEVASLGVPRDKILPVVNAPTVGPESPDDGTDRQDRALISRRLRVLYLGRLDHQKGVDRVAEIARSLSEEPDRYEVAIVGSAIVDDTSLSALQELGPIRRPPVYEREDVAELLGWADVLILPSRYEGLPLTILEAQAFGAIPIATNVGAVEEAILDRVDGYLVDEDAAVEQTVSIIKDLEARRDLRLAVAAAGIRRRAENNWTTSTAPLLSRLEDLISRQRRAREVPSWILALNEEVEAERSPLQG
jgi:glycosyltransferase involved in cell wall biosynthesis